MEPPYDPAGPCECQHCREGVPWTPEEQAAAQVVRTVQAAAVLAEMDALHLGDAFVDRYEEECWRLFVWCLLHDAVYYGAPRESFCEGAGRLRAARGGRSVVVLEDMS